MESRDMIYAALATLVLLAVVLFVYFRNHRKVRDQRAVEAWLTLNRSRQRKEEGQTLRAEDHADLADLLWGVRHAQRLQPVVREIGGIAIDGLRQGDPITVVGTVTNVTPLSPPPGTGGPGL
jgi:hypothetical protein